MLRFAFRLAARSSGDPPVPNMAHAREMSLELRFKRDLLVNDRTIRLTYVRLCPLKEMTEEDIDFVVLRENTEGLYVGMGGILRCQFLPFGPAESQ